MLQTLTDNYLKDRNIQSRGQCYFIQRWAELTDSRTLYSYQYTYHNFLSALNESIDIINKTLAGTYPNNEHLRSTIEEIKRFLENDILFKDNKASAVNEFKGILGKSIKEEHHIRYLKAKIESLSHELNKNYTEWLATKLITSIKLDEFDIIEKCINILISYCIHNGWSLKGLFEIYKTLFRPECMEIEYSISNFLNYLYYHEDTYKVFIQLNEKWTEEDSENIKKVFEFDLNDGETLKETYSFVIGKHNYCVSTLLARDPYSAALKSIEKQKKSIEFLFFYGKLNTGQFVQTTYPVYSTLKKHNTNAKIKDIYRTDMKINDSNSIYTCTLKLFDQCSSDYSTIQRQLQSVFTYVNISKNSPYQEEKFLNLWIALESFMNTGQHSCNISHIKEVLPSIMAKRYFYRIIRNLYDDLNRCNISFHEIDSELNENLPKQQIVMKLNRIIENEDKFQRLLDTTNGYTLLSYRLKQIREMLQDSIKAKRKIQNYMDTVRWHVQRMYRLRNDITHDSLVSENDLTPFIEHLHDFLATTISEVVFMSSENGFMDINHIFAHITTDISIYVDPKNKTEIDEIGVINYL